MVVYVSCRVGHPRVASLAALPQFTFCPHPAGCKFIGNINLVGEAIGLPHYGLMDAWATTGRPYVYMIASDLQTAG